MRQSILIGALCAMAWAQSSNVTTSTAVDINGHRIQQGSQVVRSTSPGQSETTEKMQSINGRMVPMERIEEKVVREDASGRVVERIIRGYDPQGNPTPPVKETVEEQKRPDGSATIRTTTYRGDINGGMQLFEKSVTESRKSGSQETAETTIQRPTINGSLETVQRQTDTTVKDASGGYQEETVTYRKGTGGGLYAAARKSIEHVQQGPQATENTAEYEIGSSGQLELHGQTVSRTVELPDGSKSIVTDVFGKNVPGTVNVGGSSSLKLQEQQVIERKRGPNDSVVETVNVRRPSVSDPTTLGPARQLSETVCRGNCKP